MPVDTHAHASEDQYVGADMDSMLHAERACTCAAGIQQLKQNASKLSHATHSGEGMYARACPMSAERRPGVRIPDKYLRTHVRVGCMAAGANISYRMVASDDVDVSARADFG